MNNAQLIITVRLLRKFVVALDSVCLPINLLNEDNDYNKLIPDELQDDIINVATKIHKILQQIEDTNAYKEAVVNNKKGEENG